MKLFIEKLDNLGLEEYSKSPCIESIAKKVNVQPKSLLLVFAALLSLVLFIPFIGNCIASTVLFFYPAYKTYKAIETTDKKDDEKLMTYWVVFGLIFSFDSVFRFLLSFLPFYHLLRFALMSSLIVGNFSGSQYLYMIILRPILSKYIGNLDQVVESLEAKAKSAAKVLKKE